MKHSRAERATAVESSRYSWSRSLHGPVKWSGEETSARFSLHVDANEDELSAPWKRKEVFRDWLQSHQDYDDQLAEGRHLYLAFTPSICRAHRVNTARCWRC